MRVGCCGRAKGGAGEGKALLKQGQWSRHGQCVPHRQMRASRICLLLCGSGYGGIWGWERGKKASGKWGKPCFGRGSGRATGNERRLAAYWFESVWEEKIAEKKGRRSE